MDAVRRAGMAGALVLALLWAQALGLAHRVMHLPVQAGLVHLAPAHGHHHGSVGVWEHFKHTPLDASDCRLYDQMAHDHGAVAEPVVLHIGGWAHGQPSLPVQARAALAPHYFEARGPPHRG